MGEVGVEGEVIASVLGIFVCLPILTFTAYYFICIKLLRNHRSNEKHEIHFPAYISPADNSTMMPPAALTVSTSNAMMANRSKTPVKSPNNHERNASSSSGSSGSVPCHQIQEGSPPSPSLRKSLFLTGLSKVSPTPELQHKMEPDEVDLERSQHKEEHDGSVLFSPEENYAGSRPPQDNGKAWHKDYNRAPKQISILHWMLQQRSPSYRSIRVEATSPTS